MTRYNIIIETAEVRSGVWRADVVSGPEWAKKQNTRGVTEEEAYEQLCGLLRDGARGATLEFVHANL